MILDFAFLNRGEEKLLFLYQRNCSFDGYEDRWVWVAVILRNAVDYPRLDVGGLRK